MNRDFEVAGGDIDLIALDQGQAVAVEVRTVSADGDPIDAITVEKRSRVQRLAAMTGITRIDLIGVRLGADAIEVHWLPDAV